MEIALAQEAVGFATADFSLLSLFERADWVVKTVIIILVLSSLWSWTVIFEKIFILRRVRRQTDHFERVFWSDESPESIYRQVEHKTLHPMASVFVSAMREWARTNPVPNGSERAGMLQRIERTISMGISREMARLEGRLLSLATIGSVAPFVGLFGTVWGIMDSFQAIALTQDTSLAVVAPGIAEALFATALGLLAAIPAVTAYNTFTNNLTHILNRLDHFGDAFITLVNRQIEQI